MSQEAETQPVKPAAWGALALLTLVYTCHAVDRSVMSIVAEPVKAEFALSDSEIGLLTGLGYAIVYAIAGVPIGYLIDRTNRRNLLTVLVTVWSALTAMAGFAQGFWHLLLARMAVGGAEAGGAPASLSMIGDLFPERRRSSAVSIFWLSTALGTAISFGLGGFVAANYGWRAAFFVAGTPGLVLALLLFLFLREPKRGSMEKQAPDANEKAPSLLQTVRFMAGNAPVLHNFIGTALNSCVLSGVVVWAASYFIRAHDLPLEYTGIVVGLCIAVFGGLGSLLGGILGDWLVKRVTMPRMPLLPFATSIATTVILAGFALTTNLYIAVALFAAFEVSSRMHTAPAYSFHIGNLPPRMRGVTISALQVCSNLIGYGMGPFVVGAISDSIPGDDSIRYGLLGLTLISVWVSIHFYLASRGARADVAPAPQTQP